MRVRAGRAMSDHLDDDGYGEQPPPGDIDDLRRQLRERGLMLDRDDPALAMHTINEVFVERLQSVLHDWEQKQESIIASITEHSSKKIDESVSMLKDHTLKASLKNTLASVQENAQGMAATTEATLAALRSLRTQILVATGVFWLGVVIALGLFIKN